MLLDMCLQVEALNDQLVSTARKVEDREADLNRLVRDKDGLQVGHMSCILMVIINLGLKLMLVIM